MELKLVFTLLLLLVAFLPIAVAIAVLFKGEELLKSESTLFMLIWGLSFLSLHIIINTL